MVHMTPEEIAEYRAKREAQKAKEAEEARKTQEQKDLEASKAARAELEEQLERRFYSSGGTTTEWRRVKERVVTDAIIVKTLAADEPEPEKPVIPAPLPRSRYQ